MAETHSKISRTCELCGVTFLVFPAVIRKGHGRFCSTPCRAASMPKRDPAERLWAKVVKTDSCWLWTGRLEGQRPMLSIPNPCGERRGRAPRKMVLAYRLSWELANGPIPDGMDVCHNCPGGDNPLCVNPAHLFLGTQRDNMLDAMSKGRMAHGERHGFAKLTDELVRNIRTRFAAGGVMQKEIASELGMTTSQISDIINRKSWRHVE